MTLQIALKTLIIFTGSLYYSQLAAAAPEAAAAAGATAAVAAVEAAAAAASASSAAAAGALSDTPDTAPFPAASSPIRPPEAPLSDEQLIPAESSQAPDHAAQSRQSGAAAEEGAAGSPFSGDKPSTRDRFGFQEAPEPTSAAPPAGASPRVDVSAEDNSTFEPRLYLPQQLQQQLQQEQRWMNPQMRADLLAQLRSAAQAWDAYRRQRFQGMTDAAAGDYFLARRTVQQ